MGFKDTPAIVADPKTPLRPIIKAAAKVGNGLNSGSQTPARNPNALNPTPGIWSSGRTNTLKSGLAAARAPSQAASRAPRPNSVMMPAIPTTASALASGMGNLNLNNASKQQDWRGKDAVYNPSIGPTKSTMTTTPYRNTTAAPSQASSARSARQPHFTDLCRISNFTRRDYRLGDVIAGPFHTSNTNPHVERNDARLTLTCEGPAYSKRRMMVVMFVHLQDLYCLPLYSFGDRGLREKPEYLKKEYVCMANEGDASFVNQGIYAPVEIRARRPVTANTTVHLAGGLRVGCNEDVTSVGRLTRKSYLELVELWEGLVGAARREPWR
jgi:hypothetical protein